MATFYVTFGQKYRHEPHPAGGHPEGWFEYEAEDRNAATKMAYEDMGEKWASIYSEEEFRDMHHHFPRGRLKKLKTTAPRRPLYQNPAETYDIIDTEWRSGILTVGFVLYRDKRVGYYRAVVGALGDRQMILMPDKHDGAKLQEIIVPTMEKEEAGAWAIAAHGAKLTYEEAKAFFPYLKYNDYKTAWEKGEGLWQKNDDGSKTQ